MLEEVVGAGHRFALPARLGDDTRRGTVEVRGREGVEIRDGALNARPQLFDGLLSIGLRGRLLAREPRCCNPRSVARGLNLFRERELVGRQADPEEHARIEGFGLSERVCGFEPAVELTELLLHLAE